MTHWGALPSTQIITSVVYFLHKYLIGVAHPTWIYFFGARYHRITMPCDPVPSRRRKDQGDFFLRSPYDCKDQGDFFTVTVWFTHVIRPCHDHLSGHNKEAYHGLDLVTLGTCSLASQWDSCQWQWVSPWKCSVTATHTVTLWAQWPHWGHFFGQKGADSNGAY